MSKSASVRIELPGHMAGILDRAVARGEFVSRDQAVRAAVDSWLQSRLPRARDDAELARMLQAAIDSGPGRDVDEVCDELIARYSVPKSES